MTREPRKKRVFTPSDGSPVPFFGIPHNGARLTSVMMAGGDGSIATKPAPKGSLRERVSPFRRRPRQPTLVYEGGLGLESMMGFLNNVSVRKMAPSLGRTSTIILLIVFSAITGFSQTESLADARSHREKLVVLPFELYGLSAEEGFQLTHRFADVLGESNRFEIILADSLKGGEGISDPRSLAEAGKVLGVQKVVHVDVVRREKLNVLQIRLVNVSDAVLLYAERVDFSGEFASLLSDIIPQQAQKLSKAHLDAKTLWAEAALLFGACLGAILWIFWHFKRKDATRGDSSAGPKE